jgi:hypothetical protein
MDKVSKVVRDCANLKSNVEWNIHGRCTCFALSSDLTLFPILEGK